ncbi:MAG: biotin/lipoyl-binding protein, partial [Bacillota bacterium]
MVFRAASSSLWSFVKRNRWPVLGVTCALITVALFAFAHPNSADPEDPAGDVGPGVAVEVAVAECRDIRRTVRVGGKVSARLSVDLTPRISGTVREVLVHMGDPVEEGDAIVRLDDADVRSSLMQAEAGLEMAAARLAQLEKGVSEEEIAQLRAALDQAEAAADMARWAHEQTEELYRGGAVSRLEMEEATVQYRSAEAGRTAAEMNLKMALDGPD